MDIAVKHLDSIIESEEILPEKVENMLIERQL